MDLTFLHNASGVVATISVRGSDIMFGTVDKGVPKLAPMEGINLNVAAILLLHPDLKGKPINEIKKEGIKRFKEHFFGFKTDKEKIDYLKKDLKNFGYKLIMYQLPGKEPVKVNSDGSL